MTMSWEARRPVPIRDHLRRCHSKPWNCQPEVLFLWSKGSCDWGAESPTLTAGVLIKVRVYLQISKQGSGRQATDTLQFGLWVRGFFKGKNKEAAINHHHLTFLQLLFFTSLTNRNIVDLLIQYCVTFWCIAKWFSFIYTYIYIFLIIFHYRLLQDID